MRQQVEHLPTQAVLGCQVEVLGLLPLEVEESLVAEVALAQEAVLAEQVALEISLLAEQVLLDHFTKGLLVAGQVLQVTVAQETAQLVGRVVSAEAEAVRPVLALAVKEETELSISITRHHSRLVNLYSIKESHNGSN
jgi:hypothetical protein